jgi:hypothetical protein
VFATSRVVTPAWSLHPLCWVNWGKLMPLLLWNSHKTFPILFLRLFSVFITTYNCGMRQCSCLRHYAMRQKLAGSISDAVTGISNIRNPSRLGFVM